MNKVILIGRLTKDPDIKETSVKIARYTLAVDRFKKGETDFITRVAFGKQADFAERYMRKGQKFAIEGRIQTGSYEKDGKKVYTTDVIIVDTYFVEKKQETQDDGFRNIPDDLDLPFA